MNLDTRAANFLELLAKRCSMPGQCLSLCQDERWLYLLSYDKLSLLPRKSMRMQLFGANRARIELYYPRSHCWAVLKEAEPKVLRRKEFLDSGENLQLGLAYCSAWRDFGEYQEYESFDEVPDIGGARYYRLDAGALAERRINSMLPRDCIPVHVIGLKSGSPFGLSRYLATRSREARIHLYDHTALPTLSSGRGEVDSGNSGRLGLGIPLYETNGGLLLAEFFPQALVPSVFMLLDIDKFARACRKELVSSLLDGVVRVVSFLRDSRDSVQSRAAFLAQVLTKDFATLRGSVKAEDGIPFGASIAAGGSDKSSELLGALRHWGIS